MSTKEPNDAVVLHSSWRSGGTYVWSKFRALPQACCFYEPLYEGLASITPLALLRDRSAIDLNHPDLLPYKLEYLPLIEGTGVRGFPAQSSYGNYLLAPGEDDPALAAYLDGLISFADQHGRKPVLGFVRSSLRAGWFKSRVAGCHIAIKRDRRHQWFSYLHQATQGNTYFLERGAIILGRNLHHPIFAGLRRLIDLPDYGKGLEQEVTYQMLSVSLTIPQQYIIYAYLQELGHEQLTRYADLTIDIDAISLDSVARQRTEQDVQEATGLSVSFGNAHVMRHDDLVAQSAAFYDDLDALVTQAMADSLADSGAIVPA